MLSATSSLSFTHGSISLTCGSGYCDAIHSASSTINEVKVRVSKAGRRALLKVAEFSQSFATRKVEAMCFYFASKFVQYSAQLYAELKGQAVPFTKFIKDAANAEALFDSVFLLGSISFFSKKENREKGWKDKVPELLFGLAGVCSTVLLLNATGVITLGTLGTSLLRKQVSGKLVARVISDVGGGLVIGAYLINAGIAAQTVRTDWSKRKITVGSSLKIAGNVANAVRVTIGVLGFGVGAPYFAFSMVAASLAIASHLVNTSKK